MGKVRNKKSEVLTKDEIRSFKAYVDNFNTLTDAMYDLQVNNVGIITRAIAYGKASPETVAKIRAKI